MQGAGRTEGGAREAGRWEGSQSVSPGHRRLASGSSGGVPTDDAGEIGGQVTRLCGWASQPEADVRKLLTTTLLLTAVVTSSIPVADRNRQVGRREVDRFGPE